MVVQVTDFSYNASNAIKSATQLSASRQGCVAHRLNKIVQKATWCKHEGTKLFELKSLTSVSSKDLFFLTARASNRKKVKLSDDYA